MFYYQLISNLGDLIYNISHSVHVNLLVDSKSDSTIKGVSDSQ